MKRRALFAAAAALPALHWLPAAAADADPQETRKLQELFERYWEDLARRYPEWSTWKGDHRFDDKLGDESKEAWDAYDVQVRAWLAEAKAIRRDRLAPTDRVSLDLFIGNLERHDEEAAFPGLRTLLVGANGGVQSDFADLMHGVPVRNARDLDNLLARMAAYPKQMDQHIANMRRGIAMGWVPAKPVLASALKQLQGLLAMEVEAGPYFAPFKRMGRDISASDQSRLRAAGNAAIARDVLPTLRMLQDFIAADYMAKAPASGALLVYPDGKRAYDMLARHRTTTKLTPAEIHAIGQRELAKIRAEMEGIVRETGFSGDFAAFVRYLNTDPKFFHTSREALLAGYRDIAKRIDAELPRLFVELPRAPYGVRAMPDFKGPGAAEYYDGPALDGSRGGWFNANAVGWRTRPKWRMATLTAHEAVPGHHLQIARATELKGLPQFRRGGGYTAFVEGWAVYAETLGREIGLYDDPYARFGHLQWQAFRAVRLVVDTGIHNLGWSRQQAIDVAHERTGMDLGFVEQEIDRYTSSPGQALGYMIGKLKIDELRDRAKAKLGAKFDLRKFHNAVIDNGALPLDVLERLIGEWVAGQ